MFGTHIETRRTDESDWYEIRTDNIDWPTCWHIYHSSNIDGSENVRIAVAENGVCVFSTRDAYRQDIVIDMLETHCPYDMSRFIVDTSRITVRA